MFNGSDYTSFMHSHSMVRIRVTAPTHPPTSRTFDICRGAPLSRLGAAFLLATGRARPNGPGEQFDWNGDVESLIRPPAWHFYDDDEFSTEPPTTLNIPGIAADCEVEVLTDASAAVIGEPHVRIVDGSPDAPRAASAWESSPATFHLEHVQHELTREFGLILPDSESVWSRDLNRSFGRASSLRSLAEALPPVQRLALRGHLEDAQILTAPTIDVAKAQSLTQGLAWLIERIGPGGVEQDEHGWLPTDLAREAEQALEWMPMPGAPPSPGHALLSAARSLRFIRRLKGRVLPLTHTRALPADPVRAVRELGNGLQLRSRSHSWSGRRDRAETLALLAIADGTATTSAGLNERVMRGLAAVADNRKYGSYDEYASHEPIADAEHEVSARQTVSALMEVLAPLGGRGGYGHFTPAVRAFAHSQLLPPHRYPF